MVSKILRNATLKIGVKHNEQKYYYSNYRCNTQSRGRYIVIAPKVEAIKPCIQTSEECTLRPIITITLMVYSTY